MTVLDAHLFEADHRVHPRCCLRLHVGGATAVEIAALFNQSEGITGPVFALGFHYINVRQQKDRLGIWITAGQHRHQAAFLRMIRDNEGMQVDIGKPAAFSRTAMREAARVQLPEDKVVLVSTNSL